MPRRKQDRPKRMKWDDSGEPCKEDDCGDDNMASSSQGSDCEPGEDEGGGGEGGNVRKTPSPRSTSRGSAMSEEPRISPLMTTTISYTSPSPMARTSPMSPRASPMLSSRGSPLVMPPGELLLKTSVIVNHIHEASTRQHINDQDCPLDFSVKKGCEDRHSNTSVGILNLSKVMDGLTPSLSTVEDRPLDLSVPRKRNSDAATPDGRKTPKVDAAAPLSPWGAHFPFRFTPSSSPTSSVEIPMWNGKVKNERISSTNSSMSHHHHHHHHHHHQSKTSPSPEPTATKALEKMTELTRMGGQESEVYHRMLSGGGRQSAWQSHWLSKGAEQARDVLKCVWCKQSFKSLAEMTAHMKEARHCGVNVSAPIAATSSASKVTGASPVSAVTSVVGTATTGSTSSSGASSTSEELNMLIKETMPLPRKLVRGQDVWLGKGAEQTKQILKCMWCGQSFKSLADMTTHMQQTQHYTNIISQEQIISWKSPEDKSSAQSHVNAVLTCKVCDQAFSSLKDLSNHMVKNSHYKEHILRSITESGGRRRQTREKRKKSLPVRKLLELERAQQEVHKSPTNHDGYHHRKSSSKETATVTCEKCAEKIETTAFVEHVRQCVGSGSGSSRNLLKSALMSNEGDGKEEGAVRSQDEHSDGGAGGGSRANSVDSNQPRNSTISTTRRNTRRSRDSPESESEAPSVLNAIERLIEKSFDTRTRKSVVTSLGSSSTNILKRLGVEDSAHYTKPLMDNCSPLPPTATAGILSPNRPSSKDTSTSADGSLPRTSPIHDRGGGAKSTSPAPINSPDARATPCPGGNCCSPAPPVKGGGESAASSPQSHAHSPSAHSVKNNPRETPSPIDPVAEDDETEKVKKNILETTMVVVNADVERKSPAGSSSGSSTSDEPRVDDKGDVKVGERARLSPRDSPDSLVSRSPCTSECSFTHQTPKERVDPCPEDLSVKSRDSDKVSTPSPTSPGAGSNGSGGRFFSGGLLASSSSTGDHPLKELQKLLDKTDAHMTKASTSTGSTAGGSTSTTSTSSHHQGSPGAILAFSWACNDAVMTDSIMKCAFCDTPFISKGAYRHHLSKMHFVKDGSLPDGGAIKVLQHSKNMSNNSSGGGNYSKSTSSGGKTNTNNNNNSNSSNNNNNNNNNNISNTNNNNNFDESPTSKFLKYTELAKQLSSKYV